MDEACLSLQDAGWLLLVPAYGGSEPVHGEDSFGGFVNMGIDLRKMLRAVLHIMGLS